MPSFAPDHAGGLTDEQRAVLVKSIWERWDQAASLPANIPTYRADTSGTAAAGKAIFAAACSRCHGDAGKGGSAGGLHNRAFLALVSDQLLRRIMITGRPDLGCPNFEQSGTESSLGRPLTGTDIANVVALFGEWRSKEEKELIDGP
jgi:mono/diheme cytochrome c family protein